MERLTVGALWVLESGLPAVVGGFGLGLVFFGGLHWTSKALLTGRHPAVLWPTSLALRLGIVLPGWVWIMAGSALRGLAVLVGFLMARNAVFWWSGRQTGVGGRSSQEPSAGGGQ